MYRPIFYEHRDNRVTDHIIYIFLLYLIMPYADRVVCQLCARIRCPSPVRDDAAGPPREEVALLFERRDRLAVSRGFTRTAFTVFR